MLIIWHTSCFLIQEHGFDLDLTYITNRVIAMSAPALGTAAKYRNDGHVVSRFMSLHHYAGFFVFNLCDTYISSDGVIGNYHPRMFFNQVQVCKHNTCTISLSRTHARAHTALALRRSWPSTSSLTLSVSHTAHSLRRSRPTTSGGSDTILPRG